MARPAPVSWEAMNSYHRTVASLLTGMCLAVFGIAKMIGGYQPVFLLPAWLFYGVASAEVVCAVAVVLRPNRHIYEGAILLAMLGVAIGVAYPGRMCGCASMFVPMAGPLHVVVASAFGALAVYGYTATDNAQRGNRPL